MIDIINKVIYVNLYSLLLLVIITFMTLFSPWEVTVDEVVGMFSILFKLVITNLALFGSIRIWIGYVYK